jgi:hypothetical protein
METDPKQQPFRRSAESGTRTFRWVPATTSWVSAVDMPAASSARRTRQELLSIRTERLTRNVRVNR